MPDAPGGIIEINFLPLLRRVSGAREIVVWGLIINDRGGNLSGFVDSRLRGFRKGCIPGSGGNCFHLIPGIFTCDRRGLINDFINSVWGGSCCRILCNSRDRFLQLSGVWYPTVGWSTVPSVEDRLKGLLKECQSGNEIEQAIGIAYI